MADRPSVEAEVVVAAPPDLVWRLVADVERMGAWSPECREVTWLPGERGPDPGSRFQGRNRRGDWEWESVSTVTEAVPGRTFAWAVNADQPGGPSATWRFELTPVEVGTRVVQSAVMGPGPSGLTARIDAEPAREEEIIAFRLAEHRRNMAATLAALKDEAEQAAARPVS